MRLIGEGLTCERGGRELFHGVGIRLASGEGLLIEGPNGSGKTTLIRAIAGLGRFAAGSLNLEGGEAEASLGEQAHYVGHADATKAQLTVAENLAFWTRFLGGGDISEGLAVFDLNDIADLPAQFLSAGQRRKLSLSRLKLVPRPIWLLDEPTASLDRMAQERLARLMDDHVATGGILLATTHMELGAKFAQRLSLGGTAP
ncbi:MAG: heme ABC exporter ATP-binding protein CcmA [Hyphomicrobiales bacterium]|nr:heme ABC exporter ATP-binding protein CcmA [Hyphomicrobiales bacterium]